MSDKSAIEWTDATWNPITGCDQVSPGCDHCYALTLAARLKAMGNPSYQTDGTRKTSGPGFGVALHPHLLDQPLRWKRPRRVFVNSMSDLFHPDVPDHFIADVFAVMMLAPQHTFQVLTKRPRRMAHLLGLDWWPDFVRDRTIDALANDPDGDRPILAQSVLPNVWLGVSVENQEWADKRIPLLLETPAAVRFLSCEPLLGPIEVFERDHRGHEREWYGTDYICLDCSSKDGPDVLYREINQPAIHWVIVGGESGQGARPMHPEWARSLRDQCVAAGIPYFFKQWGAYRPADNEEGIGDLALWEDGTVLPSTESADEFLRVHGHPEFPHGQASFMLRAGKKRAGRELDGREWDEMPERVG